MSLRPQSSRIFDGAQEGSAEKTSVIIGLYGVPGAGKTYTLNGIKDRCGKVPLDLYEGSTMIAEVTPGGLDAFRGLDEQIKTIYRGRAIEQIRARSTGTRRAAIVTGHYALWDEAGNVSRSVLTESDSSVYSHIIYLDTPAPVILEQCGKDPSRSDRLHVTAAQLQEWQDEEKTSLRKHCYDNGILFVQLYYEMPTLIEKVWNLVEDFCSHSELGNLMRVGKKLDECVGPSRDAMTTVLVIDADKTLADVDTGHRFFERISPGKADLLKSVFGSQLSFSYGAFRQASLLYEEARQTQNLEDLYHDVAMAVAIHPKFLSLLGRVSDLKHIGVIVVTCGLSGIWERVLQYHGIHRSVKVIGSGPSTDRQACVVTPGVKAALITALQQTYQMYVCVFGDSVLDLDMMHAADDTVVVVGDVNIRSKTMEGALDTAIQNGLRARQMLVSDTSIPRLDLDRLPEFDDLDRHVLHKTMGLLDIRHATNKPAAKILATRMRDAQLAGPALRESHRRAGYYLATEFLTDIIGLQGYDISHVQGSQTTGYRLFDEKSTTIVALMRGGEPMADGVNDAFPLAMFVHAKDANDVKLHHVQNQRTIILVDSVINTGKSMLEFTDHVRRLHRSIRIVVVAGVAQAGAVHAESALARAWENHGKRALVALRISKNQYTGSRATDTGNRLFNTTHIH